MLRLQRLNELCAGQLASLFPMSERVNEQLVSESRPARLALCGGDAPLLPGRVPGACVGQAALPLPGRAEAAPRPFLSLSWTFPGHVLGVGGESYLDLIMRLQEASLSPSSSTEFRVLLHQ